MALQLLMDPEGYAEHDGGALRDEMAQQTPLAEGQRFVILDKNSRKGLFESMVREGGVDEVGPVEINLMRQVEMLCARVRATAVVVSGHGANDSSGEYVVSAEHRYLGAPIYVRAADELWGHTAELYMWFSQSSQAWVISRDVGGDAPVLLRSADSFARPELVTLWQIAGSAQASFEDAEEQLGYYNSVFQEAGTGLFIDKPDINCKLAVQCKYSEFRQSIRANPELIFSGATLSTFEIADLIAEIRDPATRLTSLRLHKLDLPTDAIEAMCHAFGANQSIVSLQMMEMKLGNHGAQHMSTALQNNTSIQQLSLRGNSIDEDGVAWIASALRINASVEMLSLADNTIGEGGAKAILACLEDNITVEAIALYNGGIPEEIVKKLQKQKVSQCAFEFAPEKDFAKPLQASSTA